MHNGGCPDLSSTHTKHRMLAHHDQSAPDHTTHTIPSLDAAPTSHLMLQLVHQLSLHEAAQHPVIIAALMQRAEHTKGILDVQECDFINEDLTSIRHITDVLCSPAICCTRFMPVHQLWHIDMTSGYKELDMNREMPKQQLNTRVLERQPYLLLCP